MIIDGFPNMYHQYHLHLLWTMSQTQQLQQLQRSSSSSRMCVKSWRRFAKSMRWTRPRRAPGSSFAPATTAPWSALVAGRLGSLIYMTLCDFICNMNLCCTIWLYLSLYDPITLLSLLYDFKWWYNVLHGRFNLETWNYLCIHTQSYFTDPQKRTLK